MLLPFIFRTELSPISKPLSTRPTRSASAAKCVSQSFDCLVRLDVLVEPQHIPGVVLFLDLHQSSVVRSVRRPDELFAGFAQLVDVHSMRKGLQIVSQRLDPLHRSRLLCWSAP